MTNTETTRREPVGELEAQRRLAGAAKSLRTLFDNSLVGIYILQDGRFEFVNARFQEVSGYSEGELLGTASMDLVHPEDRDIVRENAVKMLKGEQSPAYEYRIISKSGEIRWIVETVISIQYLGRLAVLGNFMDITERKQMEEALWESRRRYRELADLLPQTVFEMDTDGYFTFTNREGLRSHGYTPEDVTEPLNAIQLFIPEERESVRQNIQRLLNREEIGGAEYTALRKDGSTFPVIVYAAPIIQGDKAVGLRGVTIDITELKLLHDELEQTLEKLQSSNAELEQFAYVASHDLQEPLRMVASYTQFLARRYQSQLDADADEFIAYAVDGVNRMQKMINDLLEYSRLNTRAKPLEMTDCEDTVDQALSNLQIAIEESDAVITHEPLPAVMADPTQLLRLFQNLISNAIKFSRNSGIPKIHIRVEQTDGMWTFSVRDNGIGIDPQYADRIFLIFQRLHGREEYPGTGIGLAVCKKIAERHGGQIWVESNDGGGTTFHFTISVNGGE